MKPLINFELKRLGLLEVIFYSYESDSPLLIASKLRTLK